jgi:glutamine synthetase
MDYSGWDIHDAVYSRELLISNKKNGYRDIIASIDLSTYRRIPWENNVPFFLVLFLDPITGQPLTVDPRGILKTTMERAEKLERQCYAGVEYEVSAVWFAAVASYNLAVVFQL